MTTGAEGADLKGAEREAFVGAMFDRIACPYDRLNRILSLGRDRAWRREGLDRSGLKAGDDAVDLGTGTGDLFCEMTERVGPEGRVVGIDISEGMLGVARQKAAAAGIENPDLRHGNAQDTGLEDERADVVAMGWVLRNVADRVATYREVLRILKPGGVFCCLDMSRPEPGIAGFFSGFYLRFVMPITVRIFGGNVDAYRYLQESTAKFPKRLALVEEFKAAGFIDIEHRAFMLGNIALLVARRATESDGEQS